MLCEPGSPVPLLCSCIRTRLPLERLAFSISQPTRDSLLTTVPKWIFATVLDLPDRYRRYIVSTARQFDYNDGTVHVSTAASVTPTGTIAGLLVPRVLYVAAHINSSTRLVRVGTVTAEYSQQCAYMYRYFYRCTRDSYCTST